MSGRPEDPQQNPGEHDEEHREEQERPTNLSPRRAVFLWWVLASAAGGAAGGATFILAFLGQLFLFGGILGAAQAVVLGRYLRGRTYLWAAASFVGWIVGWYVWIIAKYALQALAPGIFDHRVGSVQLTAYLTLQPLVWAVFGAFQFAVFLAVLRHLPERRSSGSLWPTGAMWVVASAVGGALAVAASFAAQRMVSQTDGGDSFWVEIVTSAVAQAVGGAAYGTVTGALLTVLARRLCAERSRTPYRGRRLAILRMGAGLGAVLALGFGAASCYAQALVTRCDDERVILGEFPQYGGREIEPESSPVSSSCIVRFFDPAPEEEIFAYYSETLRENGWEVEKEPPPYSEISYSETSGSPKRPGEETAPATIQQSGLVAKRGTYSYHVSYSPQPRSEEARVVVSVAEARGAAE